MLLDTSGLDLLTDLGSTTELDDQEAEFFQENPLIAVLTPYLDNQRQFIPGSTVGVVMMKERRTDESGVITPPWKGGLPGTVGVLHP